MDLFVELIQIALGNRKELSQCPTKEQWEYIFNESQTQAVCALLLDGLETIPEKQRPPLELLLQWIGFSRLIAQTGTLHQERARELTRSFNSAGFRSCILKGVGMSLLYPNPLRRQCGDIDIWVDGDRKNVMSWLTTQCTIGSIVWHHVDANFFEDVAVEVHFRPSWLYNPLHHKRLRVFFDEEKSNQMLEREEGFGHPTPVFNAIFALTHAFHHLLEEGVGFRHVVDYYYIIKGLTGEEKIRVLQVIDSIGMRDFLGAMMYVLKNVCGLDEKELICEPNKKKGVFLLNEIKSSGNFGMQRRGSVLKHNSVKRFWVMTKYYPSEAIWMIPWKVYQLCWRTKNA